MVQNLIAFVSFEDEVNRFLANEFIEHLAVEIVFSALHLIVALSKKFTKIFKVEPILLCFEAIGLGDELMIYFWIVFVDGSI